MNEAFEIQYSSQIEKGLFERTGGEENWFVTEMFIGIKIAGNL